VVKEVKQCRKSGGKEGDFANIFQKMTCDERLLFQIKETQVEDEHPTFT